MRRSLPIAIAGALLATTFPLPAVAQLPTGGSDVILVDAGAEPRRELRYDWTVGHREHLRSSVTVDMAAVEGGRPVMTMELPVSITVNARVTQVEENGTATVAMTFEDATFGPLSASGTGAPGGDAAAAAAFDEAMAAVTPLLGQARAWQVISDRGAVLRSTMDLPEGFPGEVEERMVQASSTVALLPEEPVGVGARWESTGSTMSQGVSLSVTTTMEVTAMEGDDVTLAMSTRLADGTEAVIPTVNPFDTFEVQGGGTYHLDLGGVFPRQAAVDMDMAMAGDIPDGSGRSTPVVMDIGLAMSLEAADVT
ncbi:MAG: hypothetical protein PVG27_08655 [Chloroflexota bacterium]|jgi:hypothetical protein